MKDENQEHPSPDVLADVVEGAAVDAVWLDHVSRCRSCAKEVESLQKVLETASANEVPQPEAAYWESFNPRLKSRIDGESKKSWNRWVWAAAAAAAAVVATGFWALPSWMEAVRPLPPASSVVILPPVEDDEEYQALLSFAEISTDTQEWVEVLEDPPYSDFDPSQLTVDETEELRRRLEKDIEVMNHAKS